MSSRASRDGARARASGRSAEHLVLHAARGYERACEARAWKRPTPTRQVGPSAAGGRFMAIRQPGAGCDMHILLRGGRMAVAEVKSTSARSLPLRGRSGPTLKPTQAHELDAVAALGGMAAVIVRARDGWWVLSRAGWRAAAAEANEAGRKSLRPEDMDRHGVRCEMAGAVPDWLPALLAACEE